MYCDRAKSFLKAGKELRRMLLDVNWSEVRRGCDRFSCEFEFGTAMASHTCGINEIAVKSVKEALKRAIGTSCLDYAYLEVTILECCAIVNSRPLGFTTTQASAGGQDTMISPSQLAIGRSVDILPANATMPFNLEVNKHYKLRSQQIDKFWKIYSSVYQNQLHFTPKWRKSVDFDIPVGTYVLLREKNLKKFHFLHGIITRVFRGRDNLIRSVELRTPAHKGLITRHLNQICLLEHDYMRLKRDHPCSHSACVLFKHAR